jgi:hypothetical protein
MSKKIDARFYYPVQQENGDILVMCKYEHGNISGVELHCDKQGQVVEFGESELEDAKSYCRWLNARQSVLPGGLGLAPTQFLLEGVQHARYLEQKGRRYLVFSLPDQPTYVQGVC